MAVDGGVDQRRHHHATQRGTGRQQRLTHRCQLTFQQFTLDLEPHQKKEDRHPQVIDPDDHGFGQHQPIGPQAQFHREFQQLLIKPTPARIA